MRDYRLPISISNVSYGEVRPQNNIANDNWKEKSMLKKDKNKKRNSMILVFTILSSVYTLSCWLCASALSVKLLPAFIIGIVPALITIATVTLISKLIE